MIYLTPLGIIVGGGTGTASPAGNGFFVSVNALPTDPIGTATITFTGVNANSEIRVFSPAGIEVAGIESCVANQVLAWPIFAHGSPNNTVTIRIVHNDYKIKEFDYTGVTGNQNLPVQQERDPWYSNPI